MARYGTPAKVILALTLLAAILIGANQITAGETPKKIRILYTGDMMGNWLPCG